METPTDLDGAALQRLDRLGGAEFVARIIGIFLDETPRKLEAARTALAARDAGALAYAAHSLISSAANLGATGMCELSRQLERDAQAERWGASASQLAELEAVHDRVRSRLEVEQAKWQS